MECPECTQESQQLEFNTNITTDDLFYDLAYGGFITPEDLAENEFTKRKIEMAIETIKEAEKAIYN